MKNLKGILMGVGVAAAMLTACSSADKQMTTVSGLNPAAFDSTIDGKKTALFILKNQNGMEVCITNYGGRVVSLVVPDKEGKPTDVVLGFDNIRQYADTLNSPSDYGSTVGRYANRINDGKIVINGDTIQLRQNDTGNGAAHCLHGGGNTGWMNKVYDADQPNDTTLVLTLVSPDGDNGFPGEVKAKATFTVLPDNTLDIVMEATTDKETVINMTNHSYFNLNGHNSGTILNHSMQLFAERFTAVDGESIPTGELPPVDGTAFDFRKPRTIADAMAQDCQQLKNTGGIDHNFVLSAEKGMRKAAHVVADKSGITMDVTTDQPGVQLYIGNFLNGSMPIKGGDGSGYAQRTGFCLETQFYPDSVNHPEWPQPFLKAGEKYDTTTVYTFGIA